MASGDSIPTASPAYVVVGRGNWAHRMRQILTERNRLVLTIEDARRRPGEYDRQYQERLRKGFEQHRADIAWLCVPPGPHVTVMIEAALGAGLHVVAEKPWFGSAQETERLVKLAQASRRIISVHYEYCFLEEVSRWRTRFAGDDALRFRGIFHHRRTEHGGLTALDNLGTHLLSIRRWATPRAALGQIECSYGRPDRRMVWLEKAGQEIASLDLLAAREPIIQTFTGELERALPFGEFPFNLEFAFQVAMDTAAVLRAERAAAN
jgi:predicted dehydrogenase